MSSNELHSIQHLTKRTWYKKAQSKAPVAAPLIDKALSDYLAEHPDFRERTVQDYLAHVKFFRKWSAEEGIELYSTAHITEETIVEYIQWMTENYSPTTVNIRMSTLRAFLKWCYGRGYIPSPVYEKCKKLRVDELAIKFFTDEQMLALLSAPDKSTYVGFRDYCAFLVMLDTGIRIKELLSVQISDIDFSQAEIRLPGSKTKNRRIRRLYVSDKTLAALKSLINFTKSNFENPEKYAFLSYRGKKLDSSSVRHALNHYADLSGIEGRCSPHMFRHTFARNFVLDGGNMVDLQEILGHSTLEMSKHYVRLFSEDVKKQHRKHSPVKRLLS